MTEPSVPAIGRAIDSSVVVRVVRRVAADSAVCTAAATATRGLRRSRERIVAGLRSEWSDEQEIRTTEQLGAHVADSRIVVALWSLITAPSAAWREARVRRLLDPILSVDVPVRVRVVGFAIIVAVLTHTALLALLGVPVHAVGWGIRSSLMAAGAFVVLRPRALASAWRDWTAR